LPTVQQLVETLGGHATGNGWQCHCPAHDDPTPSLSVTEKNGKVLLHCHAGCSQADVIKELRARNLWPIDNGQKPTTTMKQKKHPAVIPVPAGALTKLNPITKSKWTLEHRGTPTGGWKYHNASGEVEFCVVRYDSTKGKAVIPYYWDGQTWREGQAKKDDRPLYRLHELLASELPVLVVEGEKCADVVVEGYVLTTWAGGSSAVTKTDWSPLAKRQVLVWPDADDSGSKAAAAIKRRLPHARILNIQDRPQGWDVADAVAEGLEPAAYIASCPILETAEPAIPSTEFTDIANAERFFRECGDRVHYCTVAKAWYYWTGKVWAEDDNQVVASWAKRTAKNIYEQAWTYTDPGLARKAISCKSRAKIEAMLALAKSEGHIPIRPIDMDPDPWAWNCDNGIMDLQKNIGFLRPHDQTKLHTKISPVAFDDDAKCPRWDSFLLEIMAGDEEMVSFLQRIAGYAMTGDMRERKYFTFYGPGNNGKSVLTEILAEIWGDYAATALRDTFLRNKTEGIQHDIARLRGARLVFVAETSEGAALDEELVKQWVGQDTLAGRFLYGKAFDFRPVGKLIIRTNHRPRIKGQDAGIWGRSLFVEFSERFEGERQDKSLREKLQTELPGIMRWCLVGCAEWKSKGLAPPQKVLADGAAYREAQDDIGDFFCEYLVKDAAARIPNDRLYELYRRWCDEAGISRPWNRNWLGRKMAERGYQQGRTATEKFWIGIGEK